MKLPPGSEISMEKLTGYLLVPQVNSDKSGWLARGGYTLANPERLAHDLRTQILPLDARPVRTGPFGESFEICGELDGPSGVKRQVRTIWIRSPLSGGFHFVTLIPISRTRT